ncbi:MAG: CD225/dispanin family protein [Tannerella sp.]|jgi:hypothetical protein|nr:CD225/dispanin family protein [Tannerella sp.]
MDEKTYYYLNGSIKMGPFSLDTLKHAPIRPDTLVWNKSLPDWVEARMLPELNVLFTAPQQTVPLPPPYQSAPQQPNYQGQTAQQNPYSRFGAGMARPPLPDNYLVWAILTTICCCMPLGVVAIVHSTKVNSAYYAGDYEGAVRASEDAKKWAIWSAIVCGICLMLYFLFIFFMASIGALS